MQTYRSSSGLSGLDTWRTSASEAIDPVRQERIKQLWDRVYRPGAPGTRPPSGRSTARSTARGGQRSSRGRDVDYRKTPVPLNYLTTLIYRKIVERTKCPQDQYREAYQMFGSPVGGISRRDFRRHLIRIGIAIADEDIDRLFNHLDADGNGAVDFKEMVHLLMPSDYNYNCWATEAAYRNDTAYIQKAMALPDPVLEPDTEVKQVDLDQVISLLYRKIVERTKCPQDQFREAYQMFGSPTTGIPFHEFRKNLHGLGVILEDEDALRLFNRFDSDGNGAIDFKEMVAAVMPSDYNYDCWEVERHIRGDSAYIQHAMLCKDPQGQGTMQRLQATQMAKMKNKPLPQYTSHKAALEKTRTHGDHAEVLRHVTHGLDRRGWQPQGEDPMPDDLFFGTGPPAAPYGEVQPGDVPLVTGRRPPTSRRGDTTSRSRGRRPTSAAPRRVVSHSARQPSRELALPRPGTARARPSSAAAGGRRRSAGAGSLPAGGGLAAARAAVGGGGGVAATGNAPWRTSKATGGTSNYRVVAAVKQAREEHEARVRASLHRQRMRQRRRMAADAGTAVPSAIRGRVAPAAGFVRGSGGWQSRAWAGGKTGGYITARDGMAYNVTQGTVMAGRWNGGGRQ